MSNQNENTKSVRKNLFSIVKLLQFPPSNMKTDVVFVILLWLMVISSTNNYVFVQGRIMPSYKNASDVDFNLPHQRKPVIKTVMVDGEKYDCFDIYDQPSLEHPDLKGHKIKMRPSFDLKDYKSSGAEATISSNVSYSSTNFIQCPTGTIPIRRMEKKDLDRIQLAQTTNKINCSVSVVTDLDDNVQYRGGAAALSVYNPRVMEHQSSHARISIVYKPDFLEVGWKVDPTAYGDYQPRLYARWMTVNSATDCNYDCPGFVRVSRQYPFGMAIKPVSVYQGPQYEIHIQIKQDNITRDWWLAMGHPPHTTTIGYWPSSIFTNLLMYAEFISFGGIVFGPNGTNLPQMGSGYFPDEGFKVAAFIKNMEEYADSERAINFNLYSRCYHCYDIEQGSMDASSWGTNIFFGGPGGPC